MASILIDNVAAKKLMDVYGLYFKPLINSVHKDKDRICIVVDLLNNNMMYSFIGKNYMSVIAKSLAPDHPYHRSAYLICHLDESFGKAFDTYDVNSEFLLLFRAGHQSSYIKYKL